MFASMTRRSRAKALHEYVKKAVQTKNMVFAGFRKPALPSMVLNLWHAFITTDDGYPSCMVRSAPMYPSGGGLGGILLET